MKKVISLALALSMVFTLAACNSDTPASQPADSPASQEATPTPPPADTATPDQSTEPADTAPADTVSDAKIAIVTNTVSQNEEEFRSAEQVVEKYGADRVTHVTWPDQFMTEQEQMVSVISKIAADPDVKVLIINQAVPGTNAALDKLLEVRDDVFIILCNPQENPPDAAARADLVLQMNEIEMGTAMPIQAQKLGAKVFVHYSFPRHMSQVMISTRHTLLKAKCEELGIEFVDATAPDPQSDVGTTGAQQFILEDVPKMVEKYGKDTAFFSTNCAMQVPLIKAVVDEGAIYPQPCCPSPYHGFPLALGIESADVGNMAQVMEDTKAILEEKGVLGRLSTWPVPVAMMSTVAGAEYGLKVVAGEVDRDKVDVEVLKECMKDYAGSDVSLDYYVDEAGTKYDVWQLIFVDYVTY